ncbi:hypothetical protein GCM10027570_49790 [Streptomonospora sediminis]
MLRELAAAGTVAGAALGALLLAGPAQAQTSGGEPPPLPQFDQNLQIAPITVCNANVAALAATVPVLSSQVAGDCVNGPTLVDLDSQDAYDAIPGYNGDQR